MRPITQGTSIASRVICVFSSGKPKAVKLAGAGSVCHMASMAASFILWFSDAV